MRHKQQAFATKLLDTKEAEDGKSGSVRALVSVFGNVDTQGDRMVKGAFADTLEQWQASGDPIPFIWSHQWKDLDAHIGWVPADKAKETDRGLEVEAVIDLSDPAAKKVYGLLKSRRVKQFSFAYEVEDEELTDEDTNQGLWGKVNEVRKVNLFEVGPCLLGANDETDVLQVASRLQRSNKQGRTLSAANQKTLEDALESAQETVAAIRQVLDGSSPPDEEEDSKVKSAIGAHGTGTSDSAWDAGAQERALGDDLTASAYRRMYAWVDPDGDPDTQSAYKFPHHFVSNGNPGTASTVACSAGIAVLNGGRGGAAIPAGDRQGVYNHLARHLRDGDREPPELAERDQSPPDELGSLQRLLTDLSGA